MCTSYEVLVNISHDGREGVQLGSSLATLLQFVLQPTQYVIKG